MLNSTKLFILKAVSRVRQLGNIHYAALEFVLTVPLLSPLFYISSCPFLTCADVGLCHYLETVSWSAHIGGGYWAYPGLTLGRVWQVCCFNNEDNICELKRFKKLLSLSTYLTAEETEAQII